MASSPADHASRTKGSAQLDEPRSSASMTKAGRAGDTDLFRHSPRSPAPQSGLRMERRICAGFRRSGSGKAASNCTLRELCRLDKGFRDQLESIHKMSIKMAEFRQLPEIYDRALELCLSLRRSAMGFVDLVHEDDLGPMDVVAAKGFEPLNPSLHERFRTIPARPSTLGIVNIEGRAHLTNDVSHDPYSVGTPPRHPSVHTFLGVPLKVGTEEMSIIRVADKSTGYGRGDELLLSTFANQVALAIDNARLYERQPEMIVGLQNLQHRIGRAEHDQLLALERDRIAADFTTRSNNKFTIGLKFNSLLESEDLSPDVTQRVQEMRHLASPTADEVHDVIFALAVEGQRQHEPVSSLCRLLDDVAGTPPAWRRSWYSGANRRPRCQGVQGAVHAVVKEALNNLFKHPNARGVLVSVRFEPDRADVVVQDDSMGAPEYALHASAGAIWEHIDERNYQRQAHFGLRNLRAGWQCSAAVSRSRTVKRAGLTVKVSIPLVALA